MSDGHGVGLALKNFTVSSKKKFYCLVQKKFTVPSKKLYRPILKKGSARRTYFRKEWYMVSRGDVFRFADIGIPLFFSSEK